MSMDKITRILSLYNGLLEGHRINKANFCIENDINERSFDRDIEDIRIFLSEEQSYCRLEYDKKDKSYFLTQSMLSEIPGEFIFFLVDLIMSMKGSSEEKDTMLYILYKYCELNKRDVIANYIKQCKEFRTFYDMDPILKMHWDLGKAIQEHKVIQIQYEVSDNKREIRKIKPVQLMVNNGYAYMIGYIVDRAYENPAFFRLDRIYSFKILPEKFMEEVQKEYLEKAKNYDIYNMIAGEELLVKVQVKKDMKRIVKDVFLDCTILEENKGIYTIEIKTRKQGFLQWVLGQDQYIKVISPEYLKKEIIDICKKKIMLYEEEREDL